MQSLAVWDVLIGECQMAKLEETPKGATINQIEGLENTLVLQTVNSNHLPRLRK